MKGLNWFMCGASAVAAVMSFSMGDAPLTVFNVSFAVLNGLIAYYRENN